MNTVKAIAGQKFKNGDVTGRLSRSWIVQLTDHKLDYGCHLYSTDALEGPNIMTDYTDKA